MKNKIRRTLFIGLGGSGLKTILNIKKLFYETYGEIPDIIRFLGIDTDNSELMELLTIEKNIDNDNYNVINMHKGIIRFEPYEQLNLSVYNPEQLYKNNAKVYKCIPKQNISALQLLINDTGHIRSNGRFAFVSNTNAIEHRLIEILYDLNNIKESYNDNFEFLDNEIDVFFIFSLAGGTGSGVFLDMAYLVKRNLIKKNSTFYAVAILPEIFRAEFTDNIRYVRPNAYAALKEFDMLMSRTALDKPLTLPLQDGNMYYMSERPFDICMFIDNQNKNNIYKDSRQLLEMLAHAFSAFVVSQSKFNESYIKDIIIDNVDGVYDIKDKHAWVNGIGYCEIIIKGSELRQLYSCMASRILIAQLIGYISDYTNNVKVFYNKLELIYKDLNKKIQTLRNNIARNNQIFQINLTSLVADKIVVNKDEISASYFIDKLNSDYKILDFNSIRIKDIWNYIYQYTYNLTTSKMYSDISIKDVISSLSTDKRQSLRTLILNKAEPMLYHNYMGYCMRHTHVSYNIGVNKHSDLVFYKDFFQSSDLTIDSDKDLGFSDISLKDKVTIFSIKSAIPTFAINSISSLCKNEYENNKDINLFHIDRNMFINNYTEDLSLEPQSYFDIELWVKGFIFGLIRRENGVYMYRDEIEGDILCDYWMELDSDRNKAFSLFSSKIGNIGPYFQKEINNLKERNGNNYITDLYKRAVKNYIKEFSCIEYSIEELRLNKNLKDIADLIRSEMIYIRKWIAEGT